MKIQPRSKERLSSAVTRLGRGRPGGQGRPPVSQSGPKAEETGEVRLEQKEVGASPGGSKDEGEV